MAIKHTMVSYYGLNYVEHAEADFREMIDHGVDTVLLPSPSSIWTSGSPTSTPS